MTHTTSTAITKNCRRVLRVIRTIIARMICSCLKKEPRVNRGVLHNLNGFAPIFRPTEKDKKTPSCRRFPPYLYKVFLTGRTRPEPMSGERKQEQCGFSEPPSAAVRPVQCGGQPEGKWPAHRSPARRYPPAIVSVPQG